MAAFAARSSLTYALRARFSAAVPLNSFPISRPGCFSDEKNIAERKGWIAPILQAKARSSHGLLNIEMLGVQQRVRLDQHCPPGEFLHLLDPFSAVRLQRLRNLRV